MHRIVQVTLSLHLTSIKGPGSAIRATELIPKYPHDWEPRIVMAMAFTPRGASNMKDSSNAASWRPAGCQHFASSKFPPSLEVMIFTSPGAYAQSTLTPTAVRREFRTPVHATPQADTEPQQVHVMHDVGKAPQTPRHSRTAPFPEAWLPLEHLVRACGKLLQAFGSTLYLRLGAPVA